jgi:hypothetical protein
MHPATLKKDSCEQCATNFTSIYYYKFYITQHTMIACRTSLNSRTFLSGPHVRASVPVQSQRARMASRIVCEDAPERKSAGKVKAASLRYVSDPHFTAYGAWPVERRRTRECRRSTNITAHCPFAEYTTTFMECKISGVDKRNLSSPVDLCPPVFVVVKWAQRETTDQWAVCSLETRYGSWG